RIPFATHSGHARHGRTIMPSTSNDLEQAKLELDSRRHRDEMRIKLAELRAASGRGVGFTAAQATVAAAALAVVSAIGGGFIQSMTTRHVEAGEKPRCRDAGGQQGAGRRRRARDGRSARAVITPSR